MLRAEPELLAPARDAYIGLLAVVRGACAASIGKPMFGVAASAGRSSVEIHRRARHLFGPQAIRLDDSRPFAAAGSPT
jgi:hypothetical protein